MADDVREASQSWRAPNDSMSAPTPPPPVSAARRDPATDKGVPASNPAVTTEPEPWWQSPKYIEPQRNQRHHPRTTGIVLVTLGVLLLAAQAGIFTWIEWRTMWPLIFIGLGVILLARQIGWGR